MFSDRSLRRGRAGNGAYLVQCGSNLILKVPAGPGVEARAWSESRVVVAGQSAT